MHKTLVLGAGNIGSLISVLLANSKDYKVYLGDINLENHNTKRALSSTPNIEAINLDAGNEKELIDFMEKNSIETVASSLPFHCNVTVAKAAKKAKANYFDLTEDVATAKAVTELAEGAENAFVPQCGLAPGFISVVTNDLMEHFPKLDAVKMRVGALPVNISNALQYTLTWSTDGLINEYGNLCNGISSGKEVQLLPLTELEEIKVDGLTYEAFNTSGGIGSLADTYAGRVTTLSYKTIRYPGHCYKIRLLMNDLKLNQDRGTLKKILENSVPKTENDVVLVYSSVTGEQNGTYTEENFVRKFYPKSINGISWSAIQLTTASELCAVIDIIRKQPEKYKGFVKQEQFSLRDVTTNRFGEYFA